MKSIAQRPRRARRAAGAGWAAITTVLRPAVVGPLLLSATLLVALLTVGNVATIGSLVRHVHVAALLAIVLVLVGYEAARAAQWLVLLHGLHVRAPRRVQVFTYLVGEPTRVLPIGNFVENYLLLRAAGTAFGLSAVATLTSVLIEVGAALLGLVLLGLGPWGWLRPLIVLGLATFVLCVWTGARLHRPWRLPAWVTRQRALRAVLAEARQFRHGAATLRQPRVLLSAALRPPRRPLANSAAMTTTTAQMASEGRAAFRKAWPKASWESAVSCRATVDGVSGGNAAPCV